MICLKGRGYKYGRTGRSMMGLGRLAKSMGLVRCSSAMEAFIRESSIAMKFMGKGFTVGKDKSSIQVNGNITKCQGLAF